MFCCLVLVSDIKKDSGTSQDDNCRDGTVLSNCLTHTVNHCGPHGKSHPETLTLVQKIGLH